MNISFFASAYYMGIDPTRSTKPTLFRGSSLIRGEQVAQFLGGKYNPTEGFENDLIIHIKPKSINWVKMGGWVDIVDGGHHMIEQLQTRPDIKIIAYTPLSAKYLKGILKNKIVVIPEHHCNFERAQRTRKRIATAGIVTSPSPLAEIVYGEIKKRLKKIGVNFLTYYHFQNRQDVVDFYKRIDFQVIGNLGFSPDNPFRHPNKIVNAASFGIPTIAFWMLGYQEFQDNYIPIRSMDELEKEVAKLKNKRYYDEFASKITRAAEKYHVENVAKKYRSLT